MRDKFRRKVCNEYRKFRRKVLRGNRKKIYSQSYKIDVIINLYELLLELSETIPEGFIRYLMPQKNLLEQLYDQWLKKEDSLYEELMTYVDCELKRLANVSEHAERRIHGSKRN